VALVSPQSQHEQVQVSVINACSHGYILCTSCKKLMIEASNFDALEVH